MTQVRRRVSGGFHNLGLVSGPQRYRWAADRHAACSHSLIRPPRTAGRGLLRAVVAAGRPRNILTGGLASSSIPPLLCSNGPMRVVTLSASYGARGDKVGRA